jgi:hypothetical protein
MSDADKAASPNNNDNNEPEEEDELEEEEDLSPDESIVSKVFTSTAIVIAYKNYHTDLKIVIPPHLNVCGLLLTLSFGAMYFIIKDSRSIPIQMPNYIRGLLFAIIILLSVSILLGILSIYLRPIPTSLETSRLAELAYHSEIYKTERRYHKWATVLLFTAIGLIIFSLLTFAYQGNSISSTLDKTQENNSSQNTIIYISSNNSFVNINGTGTYAINISENETSNKVAET